MYKLVIRERNQFRGNDHYIKWNTSDILFIHQKNLQERVMEKLGYIDRRQHVTSINFFRLIFLLNKYPGMKFCPKWGKFWTEIILSRKEKWEK